MKTTQIPWFFNTNAWSGLLTAVLRALLSRAHDLHKESLEDLMGKLISGIDLQQLNDDAIQQGQTLPQELAQGPLAVVKMHILTIASELNCGDTAAQIMEELASSAGSSDIEALLKKAVVAVAAEMAKISYNDH